MRYIADLDRLVGVPARFPSASFNIPSVKAPASPPPAQVLSLQISSITRSRSKLNRVSVYNYCAQPPSEVALSLRRDESVPAPLSRSDHDTTYHCPRRSAVSSSIALPPRRAHMPEFLSESGGANGASGSSRQANGVPLRQRSSRRKQSSPMMPPFMVSAPGKVIVFGEHAVVHGKVSDLHVPPLSRPP